jgi:hypothetical protein
MTCKVQGYLPHIILVWGALFSQTRFGRADGADGLYAQARRAMVPAFGNDPSRKE